MYLDPDWNDTYPEGIASYSEGLPLRGTLGSLTKKIGTLKRFFHRYAQRQPRIVFFCRTQAPTERYDISIARQGYDNGQRCSKV